MVSIVSHKISRQSFFSSLTASQRFLSVTLLENTTGTADGGGHGHTKQLTEVDVYLRGKCGTRRQHSASSNSMYIQYVGLTVKNRSVYT